MVVTAVEEQPRSLVTVTTYVELGYEGVTDTACVVAFPALALHW